MPDYAWNGTRYYDRDTGRFISSSKVRDALESVMEQSALNMNALSQQLIDGNISLAGWQSSMMQQIKLAHTAGAAAAQGGFAQMSQSDWGFAGRLIRTQYEFLDKFAGQIASGEQQLNGQVLFRADLYGQAPRGTYEAQRQRLEVANGMEEEINDLEKDGANCEGCLAQAEMGWVPVGTLDPIGSQECNNNCRCERRYRKIEDGELVTSDE